MLARAVLVWLGMMATETVLGVLRGVVLVPLLERALEPVAGSASGADVLARRLGFGVGLVCIVLWAWFTHGWMTAGRRRSGAALVGVGVLWAGLTFGFEVGIGRLMVGVGGEGGEAGGGWPAVWQRLAEDNDLTRGGLMGIGLAAMALAPVMIARWRGGRRERGRGEPGRGSEAPPAAPGPRS
jgi:hypothetical protein